tara:strand:+ start:696 stop:860 length:165 start_codon:yes stop_codon:yes gene_type:complete
MFVYVEIKIMNTEYFPTKRQKNPIRFDGTTGTTCLWGKSMGKLYCARHEHWSEE